VNFFGQAKKNIQRVRVEVNMRKKKKKKRIDPKSAQHCRRKNENK
jgi:hypothetical protein